jgi:glycosyltransferase involved in cell wall biosynthesis
LYSALTDLTVSTAEYATDNLIAEGVDKDRIKTVYNGVKKREKLDTDAIISKKTELRIPTDARIIGVVGRLESVKGQDLLIRAAPELIRRFPDLYIVFVGTGSCKRRLCELTSLLGVGDKIRFTGYLSDPHGIQSLFYVNVNPSRGTETSCLATSECMAMGIPTVASDFGGNREVIIDGLNGLLFQSDSSAALTSALTRVLSDPTLYAKLCRGAVERYARLFSFERMIDEYRKIYTEWPSHALK